ncbi:hypothetical protein [Nocardia heshunensis]
MIRPARRRNARHNDTVGETAARHVLPDELATRLARYGLDDDELLALSVTFDRAARETMEPLTDETFAVLLGIFRSQSACQDHDTWSLPDKIYLQRGRLARPQAQEDVRAFAYGEVIAPTSYCPGCGRDVFRIPGKTGRPPTYCRDDQCAKQRRKRDAYAARQRRSRQRPV